MFMVMHITYTKDLINIYNLLAYTSKGSSVTHVVDCMHRALIVPSISQWVTDYVCLVPPLLKDINSGS